MINNLAFSSQSGNGLAFFQKFIPALVVLVLIAGTVIFFFMLISGAVAWLSSSGDKQALEGARGKISNALVGIVILFSLYAILNFIGNFFHTNLTSVTINSLFAPTSSSGGGGGGIGVAACGCANGGCAQIGAIALGNQTGGTTCNQCTTNGWVVVPGTCSGNNPITCGACP